MTDSVNIRELILGILLEITRDGEYSHIAISNVLNKYQYLDKKERAFITRVSEGTLEHMIELDYIIDQFSNVKVSKMKPVIRCIMRSSVYELKYMDSVPDAATCNEAVKLAKKKGFRNLTGFVNGVLRNISRNLADITYPDKEKEFTKYLSVTYSMPEWIVQQWLRTYHEETVEQMLQSFLTEGSMSIRTNLSKITPQKLVEKLVHVGVQVEQDEEISYAFHIKGVDYLQGLESFRLGYFYVQDISSMKVAEIAAPKSGDYVIDVCAAPGGKSVHIAEMLDKTGCVEARDLTEYKVELIQENIERCGLQNMKAMQWDARILDESSIKKADIVIADLPCSGLGVMGKKTDIRYKMTPEKQAQLAVLQGEILDTVYQYVKDAGTLIYSTCTINQAENEENVQRFLDKHPEFTLVSQNQMLPLNGKNDGFFIAKLKKENNNF